MRIRAGMARKKRRLQMRRGFAIIKRKRTTATKVVASNEQLGYTALPTLSEPQGRLFLFLYKKCKEKRKQRNDDAAKRQHEV